MNKTKDEMVAEMLEAEKLTMATDRELTGFSEGCRKMYDARQREIDEANRWWATRWQSSHDWWNGPNGLEPSRDEYNLSDGQLKATREMDAAAKKVMEVK